MIHAPSGWLIQIQRRLGDAKLLRWLGRYSVGQAVEALQELRAISAQTVPMAVDKASDELIKRGVGIITPLDTEYPACFHALEHDAPPFLYIIGDVTRLRQKSIAIIGTRRPTADGKLAAQIVARRATEAGWMIVSGNAPGIDSVGHAGALDMEHGETLVFPPMPLDQYKPSFKVTAESETRVTVASPFLPGSDVSPWMFLRRNTLVAAQCRAAFVAETGVRGGTLDTVKKLSHWNRPTFATALPDCARYAAAHGLLAGGDVKLVDVLNQPEITVGEILLKAQASLAHPRVSAAVLNDFFSGEEWA